MNLQCDFKSKAWEENSQILTLKRIYLFFIVLATIKTYQVLFCQPVVFNKKKKKQQIFTDVAHLKRDSQLNQRPIKAVKKVLSRHEVWAKPVAGLKTGLYLLLSQSLPALWCICGCLYIRFYGAEMSSVLQKSYLGSYFSRINQTFATNCTSSNISVSRRLGPVYMTTIPCLCRLSRLSVSRSWTRSWRGYPRCPSEITEVLWKTCTPCTSPTVTRGGSITSNRWLWEAAWSVHSKENPQSNHNILI